MFTETGIVYILLPVFVAEAVVMLLLHLTRDKQSSPLEAAFRKFKFTSITSGVGIFILLLCLPATAIYEHLTPERIKPLENAAEYLRDVGIDLNRIKEILYWAFFITIFWFWSIFNFLKVLAAESTKKSA